MEHTCYDEILAAIGDGITVQDRDFTITYQNPVMQELFGNSIAGRFPHVLL